MSEYTVRNEPEIEPAVLDHSLDDPDAEVLGQDPLLPVPSVSIILLDGEYGCAVISLAGDPLAPNLAEQVKVRTILAIDIASLQPQVIACLIADYGMDQDAAEMLWDAAKPDLPGRLGGGTEPTPEEPVAQPGMQVFEDVRPDPEAHERARDAETGRYVAEGPAREA